ncbi:hypothetical protein A2917_01740 [Candidatus Nomurabacteria bacterium RIFCSPLOWO2_01_FULL_42_17]|uniref:Uncharacterized protein n=1 Tax=Candidatus Nomurabacteria bacterium RIFCSPLOWO2_01_FULL_42_17 TaxID=1801780 RepID=A0A1F6XLV8_9BACT|nr:MAG: hypothetical protein A2917_01740 [Candidatus Nomurabacteria bacterium RIFCSPLOWO2_01_FULL_42_17]
MSEGYEISQRIKALDSARAEEEALRAEKVVAKQKGDEAQAKNLLVYNEKLVAIKGLASRFATWASTNEIPFDFDGRRSHDPRTLFQRLKGEQKTMQQYGDAGWKIAKRIYAYEARTYGGEMNTYSYVEHLNVSEKGILIAAKFNKPAEDEYIANYGTHQIYDRIAELCVAQEIVWQPE